MPYKVFESVFGLGFECFEFFERSKVAARAVGGACSTSDGRIVAVRRLWIGLLVGLCWLGLACVGCGLAVPCVGVAEALEASLEALEGIDIPYFAMKLSKVTSGVMVGSAGPLPSGFANCQISLANAWVLTGVSHVSHCGRPARNILCVRTCCCYDGTAQRRTGDIPEAVDCYLSKRLS